MKQIIIVSLVHMLLFSLTFGYSGGPPDGFSGNPPANANCTQCHGDFGVNSGNGLLELQGPSIYIPGDTYDLTVGLTDPDQSRWGFELTVLGSTSEQAGTLVVTEPGTTQLSSNPAQDPDFLKHTSGGTFPGSPNGGSWDFQWVAPDVGVGTVTFYVAGNAANNSGDTHGDYIYTITMDIDESSGISAEEIIPVSLDLLRNYPNPFNPSTTVEFTLTQAGDVRLDVYNLLGQNVYSLWDGWMSEGMHNIKLDGSYLASGIYFAILRTPVSQKVHMMNLEK